MLELTVDLGRPSYSTVRYSRRENVALSCLAYPSACADIIYIQYSIVEKLIRIASTDTDKYALAVSPDSWYKGERVVGSQQRRSLDGAVAGSLAAAGILQSLDQLSSPQNRLCYRTYRGVVCPGGRRTVILNHRIQVDARCLVRPSVNGHLFSLLVF